MGPNDYRTEEGGIVQEYLLSLPSRRLPVECVFSPAGYLLSLPSRRLPVECAFSPDGLFEARFRVGNTSNLREGEQLPFVWHSWTA